MHRLLPIATLALLLLVPARGAAQGLSGASPGGPPNPVPRTREELAVRSREQLLERVNAARRSAAPAAEVRREGIELTRPEQPTVVEVRRDGLEIVSRDAGTVTRLPANEVRPTLPDSASIAAVTRLREVPAGPFSQSLNPAARQMDRLLPDSAGRGRGLTERLKDAFRSEHPDFTAALRNGNPRLGRPPRLQTREDDAGNSTIGPDIVNDRDRNDRDRDPSEPDDSRRDDVIDIVIEARDRLHDIEIDRDLMNDLVIIDQIRDRAIRDGNPDILVIADRMEDEARRAHDRRNGGHKTGGPGYRPPLPPLPPNGRR